MFRLVVVQREDAFDERSAQPASRAAGPLLSRA
jgi:hypothetical protein